MGLPLISANTTQEQGLVEGKPVGSAPLRPARAPAKPGKAKAKSGELKDKRVATSTRQFIKAYLKSPLQVGSFIPSSRFLGRTMAELVDLKSARTVIEYGPGTGTITAELLPRLGEHTKFFVVELSPQMASSFSKVYPDVKLYQRSIAEIGEICAAESLPAAGGVDVIISGIPWAVVPLDVQHELLTETAKVLRPGGMMLTYGYHSGLLLKSGREFAKALPKYFSSVKRTKPIWLNMPPAFVYVCTR